MGFHFVDQYSLLHFATGVIAYFWGISFQIFFILHFIFECLENTSSGMRLINLFPYWPGGKTYPDTLINIVGDNFFAAIGWFFSQWLDDQGRKRQWVYG